MTTGTAGRGPDDGMTWHPHTWGATARTLAVAGGVVAVLCWLLVGVAVRDGSVGPLGLLAVGLSVALTAYSGAMVAVAWLVRVVAAAVAEVDRQARLRTTPSKAAAAE